VNQAKGKKDRVVPIGKVALDYVAEYLERVRPVRHWRNMVHAPDGS
jgi:site-specific recombinase XerD